MHNLKSNAQNVIRLIIVCQWWTPSLYKVLSFLFICLFSVYSWRHRTRSLCMYQIDIVFLKDRIVQAL